MGRMISLDEWRAAGLTYSQYKMDKHRDKLSATRATRNKPVMIDVDSIKDEAKKQRIIDKFGELGGGDEPDIETTTSKLTQKDREIMWARWYVTLEFDKVREVAKKTPGQSVNDAVNVFYYMFCHDERWAEHRKTLSNSKGVPPSDKTIYKWSCLLKKDYRPETLTPDKPERKPKVVFTPQQLLLIEKSYANQHQPSQTDAYNFYKETCKISNWPIPTYNAFRNQLSKIYMVKGAAIDEARYGFKYAKDRHGAYIERMNDIRFMDIIVADGHLMNFHIKDDNNKRYRPMLVAYIDMATNMILGFDLMRSENTLGVASAFRNTMLVAGEMMGLKDMGIVPREVYTDNGKAFKNKYWDGMADFGNFQEGVYAQFAKYGLQYVTRALAYNARAKTIERRFRDMNPFEKRETNYLGSAIDNRPAKYRRHELIAKEHYEQALAENGWLDLHSAYAMISNWVEEMNDKPGNGKYLQGYAPKQLAAKHILEIEDWSARAIPYQNLNELMMHRKTVRLERNGVRINKVPYINQLEMAIVPKDAGIYVQVAYSPLEPDRVQVYNEDGTFWCEAEKWIGYEVSASYKQRGAEAAEKHKKAMEAQGSMQKMVDDEARRMIGLPPKKTRKKAIAESQKALPENAKGNEDDNGCWVTPTEGPNKGKLIFVDVRPNAVN